MEAISRTKPPARPKRRLQLALIGITIASVVAVAWVWRNQSGAMDAESRAPDAVHVVTAAIEHGDVPVRLAANGIVSAQQTVDVRPQLSATVREVHIKEGQFVQKGERLFTLDARTEAANLSKTEGQLVRSRAELSNAERTLERQRELFRQGFVSRAALDAAQDQVDVLRAQVAVDEAAVQGNRVTRGFSEIIAPIAGRTGTIPVYRGSLVQPNDVLVSIMQVDPINVSFTLPEREFVPLQQALAKGEVPVTVKPEAGGKPRTGRVIFIDNAIDTESGTIHLKAEFPNADHHLWPGMFVAVTLAPRTLTDVLTVPVQAVQTGPEAKFLYVIDDDNKVAPVPATVRLVQDGVAVIEDDAVTPGMRIVVEGAQNLRPGSLVTERGAPAGETEAKIR